MGFYICRSQILRDENAWTELCHINYAWKESEQESKSYDNENAVSLITGRQVGEGRGFI